MQRRLLDPVHDAAYLQLAALFVEATLDGAQGLAVAPDADDRVIGPLAQAGHGCAEAAQLLLQPEVNLQTDGPPSLRIGPIYQIRSLSTDLS